MLLFFKSWNLIYSSPILFFSPQFNFERSGLFNVRVACFLSAVEVLQNLVSGGLGGPLGQAVGSPAGQEGAVGPVSLPRRAETFGGFDSHQMNASKGK